MRCGGLLAAASARERERTQGGERQAGRYFPLVAPPPVRVGLTDRLTDSQSTRLRWIKQRACVACGRFLVELAVSECTLGVVHADEALLPLFPAGVLTETGAAGVCWAAVSALVWRLALNAQTQGGTYGVK